MNIKKIWYSTYSDDLESDSRSILEFDSSTASFSGENEIEINSSLILLENINFWDYTHKLL